MAQRTPRSELKTALARHRSGRIPESHVAAAVLHMLSGGVVLVLLPAVGSPRSPSGVAIVAAIAIAVGMTHLVFPWSRFGPGATLWIIPESLVLVVAFNLTYGDPVLYTTFFFVVWAWVGLTQPPGTAARFSPLLVAAYVVPAAASSNPSAILASSLYIVPICTMVAEVVAHVAQKLRESEELVARSEARYASLMRHASEFVVVYDENHRVRFANAAFERMVGLSYAELSSRGTSMLVHPEDRERATEWFRRFADLDDTSDPIEYRVQNTTGDWRYIEATLTNLTADEAVGGIVLTGHDITERHRATDALSTVAYTDSLTGLDNRAAFQRDLATAQTEGDVALLFLDVDGFKVINDSLGHTIGDLLLIDVARRLRASLPGLGLYRMGGDEFVLLVRERTAATELQDYAGVILAALSTPFRLEGRELRITVSVGIAGDKQSISSEELLRHADLAMYQAKRLGGGRSAFFDDELADHARRRLEIESDLHVALAGDQLLLEFQPIVDLATGRITAAEALVRWDHPTKGRLYPDTFIDVAEDAGLMTSLGELVLDEALRTCARWRQAGHDLTVSVNVSPSQLRMSFAALVTAALRRHGLPGASLCLEITEGSLVDPDMCDVVLPALRELGVSISIDDFGTGYSSLSYLHRVSVDALKIDRSFLRPAGMQGDGLVAIILSMARHLGLPVVAEGVETPAQVEFLRELGCDLAQGFYFGRPMPATELVSLLDDRSGDDYRALVDVAADRRAATSPLRIAR